MHWESQQLELLQKQMERNQRSTVLTVAGGALLITATLTTGSPLLPAVMGMSLLSWGFGIGGLTLLTSGLLRR
jgi:hypothetical protein